MTFTASSVTTYAQFFKDKESSSATTSSRNFDTDNGAGFFRNSNSGPGGRPGDGEGIGQEAPLGDGLNALVACCVLFGFVKIYNDKRKKND